MMCFPLVGTPCHPKDRGSSCLSCHCDKQQCIWPGGLILGNESLEVIHWMTKSQDNMAHALDWLATVMEKGKISVSTEGNEEMDDAMVESTNYEGEVTEKSGNEEGKGDSVEVEVEGVEEAGAKNKKRKLR